MANQIVVRQEDGLELRAKRLIIPFRTFDHGSARYDFPNLLLLEVEEVYQDKTTHGTLRIKDNVILNDTGGVNDIRGNYLPNSPFAKKFEESLDEILDEIEYAIEDHMAKKPATRTWIKITDESVGEYNNRLYFDLSK